MKKYGIFSFLILISAIPSFSLPKETHLDSQAEYERSIQAIVRNKYFFKQGKFEVAATGGIMPYDSLVNHYMFGGKLAWHLADHFGWEVIDAQLALPSVTGFTTSLVQERGLSNFQFTKLKYSLTTNLLISPFYGKIRFFGSQVLFFDIYLALGGGMANTETVKLSSSGSGSAGVESTLRTGFDPCIDFGLGFKVFSTNFMGILLDLRDYLIITETYGKKSPKSNFSVFLGLAFYLPTF